MEMVSIRNSKLEKFEAWNISEGETHRLTGDKISVLTLLNSGRSGQPLAMQVTVVSEPTEITSINSILSRGRVEIPQTGIANIIIICRESGSLCFSLLYLKMLFWTLCMTL